MGHREQPLHRATPRLREVVISPNTHKHREIGKMRRQKNVFQSKEQDKSPEKNRNEMEVNSLPNKEFKVMVIKMIPDLRRRMGEHGKSSNKEVENRGRS